jgi:hypothetical protein
MITERVLHDGPRFTGVYEYRALVDFGILDPTGRRIGCEVNILHQRGCYAVRPSMTRNGSFFGRHDKRAWRDCATLDEARVYAAEHVAATAARYARVYPT